MAFAVLSVDFAGLRQMVAVVIPLDGDQVAETDLGADHGPLVHSVPEDQAEAQLRRGQEGLVQMAGKLRLALKLFLAGEGFQHSLHDFIHLRGGELELPQYPA